MTTTQNDQTRFDPRPLLARALDQAGRLVTETDPARGADPTPCTEYDVAELISHLQAVIRRIEAVVSGRRFDSVPHEWPSTDWSADWKEGRAAVDAALADDASLDRTVTVPWGTQPVRAVAVSYVGELATHAWDLAVATGRHDQLDESIADAVVQAAQANIPPERDSDQIPFGPVVPVPEDAPAYDRLVGWCGRDPDWTRRV